MNNKFKPLTSLILGTMLSVIAPGSSAAAEDAATALAQAVYDRPSGDDSSARVLMLLKKKGKVKKKRLLYTYGVDKGNSERWTLMRFKKPADVDGTGLLTMDHIGDDSDQWLYLPALDKIRRISSKRKGGRFVGSDFFYEDLTDREVNMDHHKLIGKDKVGGAECTLLESTPVEKSNS
ncbi:MAG: outer membrane lipoprotein-sorting protein, partial [Pseudomonadota bacterium]|nr:outer membrane lipoprotein-sorting protein [Pseudomonadota bacterium]